MILPLFNETCRRAYGQVSDPGYTLEETLHILQYFFKAYENHRGEPHPPLTVKNLVRIIEALPGELYPIGEEYEMLIDAYFGTRYAHCDYRINHFLSGRVREILHYRMM